jgi:hypothetical protein
MFCKNNDNVGKIILDGFIKHSWHLLHVRRMGEVFLVFCVQYFYLIWYFNLFDVSNILICIKLLGRVYAAIP